MATHVSRARFLRSHLWVPVLLGAAALAAMAVLDGDRRLAQTFFSMPRRKLGAVPKASGQTSFFIGADAMPCAWWRFSPSSGGR